MIDLRAFLCPVSLPARKDAMSMLPIMPNYVMFCVVKDARCSIKESSSNTFAEPINKLAMNPSAAPGSLSVCLEIFPVPIYTLSE